MSLLPQTVRAFIGSLGRDASEGDLRTALAGIGVELSHVEMVLDRCTGARRGFAYVVVTESPTALQIGQPGGLLALMRSAVVCGRPITVHAIPEALPRR